MKKILFLLFLPLAVACGNSGEEGTMDGENEGKVAVSGKITDADGMQISLQVVLRDRVETIATDTILHGEFSMNPAIESFGIYQLALGNPATKFIPLTLVPGDKVQLSTSLANFDVVPNVSGTDWAKPMNEYWQLYNVFRERQADLLAAQRAGTLNDEQLKEGFLDAKKPLESYAIRAIQRSPKNAFNVVLSDAIKPMFGLDGWDQSQLDVLKEMERAYNEAYPESDATASLSNQIYQIEMQLTEYTANQSGTRDAPEITLNTTAGKTLSLSDLRGKYVLIDFWASWCAPCRKENPNVVRLYKEYKDKGFTILSVSLDTDKSKWIEAIGSDGLVWPNHVSDLQGWNSPVVALYGVQGIPHTVLVNPEGKIIDTQLRGSSLEQKLKSLFAK